MLAVNSSTATGPTPRLNRATGYFTIGVGRGTRGSSSNGRVYAHRWLMEQKLGRRLLRKEVVHHRSTRDRNEPGRDTLVFRSQADHMTFHRLERTGRLLDREMAAIPLREAPPG
jgi:hypothetical protein